MNDCELLGRHCELAVYNPQKPQKSALRPDGGVVTQRTANPHSASRIADKFAQFTLRSPHGFVRATAATANFWARSSAHKTAPARLPANEGHHNERARFDMAEVTYTVRPDGLVERRAGKMVPIGNGEMVEQVIVEVPGYVSPILKKPLPATATIYFIGPDNGPIKIGYAARINTRLRDLRLANALPLKLWASVIAAPSLEREYHKRFKEHRLHGEWFARHPEILAEIDRLNQQVLG